MFISQEPFVRTAMGTEGPLSSLPDSMIQNYGIENILALQQEYRKNEGVQHAFVAFRQTIHPDKVSVDFYGLIYAVDMWEAIQVFCNGSRDRTWLPTQWETRQELQFGFDRSVHDNRIEYLWIQRIRKDQIFSKLGEKLQPPTRSYKPKPKKTKLPVGV